MLLGPITMISFLLSLCLVERRQRHWRYTQHHMDGGAERSRFATPDPYQSPSTDHKGSLLGGEFQGWYYRKQHRAVAKMNIEAAFDLSGRLVLVTTACLCLVLGIVGWGLRLLY